IQTGGVGVGTGRGGSGLDSVGTQTVGVGTGRLGGGTGSELPPVDGRGVGAAPGGAGDVVPAPGAAPAPLWPVPDGAGRWPETEGAGVGVCVAGCRPKTPDRTMEPRSVRAAAAPLSPRKTNSAAAMTHRIVREGRARGTKCSGRWRGWRASKRDRTSLARSSSRSSDTGFITCTTLLPRGLFGEHGAHDPLGGGQASGDCAAWDTERRGDLLLGQVGVVGHDHDDAQLRAERCERDVGHVSVLDALETVGARVVHKEDTGGKEPR